MNDMSYRRKPGDLEIRVLRDGRLVFVSPDGELLRIVRSLEAGESDVIFKKESAVYDRIERQSER